MNFGGGNNITIGATLTMDDGLVGDAVKVGSGFFGLGGGIVTLRWFILWLTGRHDAREAALEAKDGALDERWAKYTKRMEERCEQLEQRVEGQEKEIDECHRSKRELEGRIAKLEGLDLGVGENRQNEALLRALADRLALLENRAGRPPDAP